MAISQKKIHSLIRLARQLIAVYESNDVALTDALGKFESGNITIEQFIVLCRDISFGTPGALAPLMLELEREEIHYEMTHKKNESERLRKLRVRHGTKDLSFDTLTSDEIANALRDLETDGETKDQ